MPERVRVVCGHDISAKVRTSFKDYASGKNIGTVELWSGTEFEEFIRSNGESLISRYLQGDPFPDAAKDLLLFAWGIHPTSDQERLAMLSMAIDHPAFFTPIWRESSLPAFRQAIEDTLRVLKTGVWKTREGEVVQRLPKSTDFDEPKIVTSLNSMAKHLVNLRTQFDELVRAGEIKHCSCTEPNCPVYAMSDVAVESLTKARGRFLEEFRAINPNFEPSYA